MARVYAPNQRSRLVLLLRNDHGGEVLGGASRVVSAGALAIH